ncbi:uncharacterized protein LOC118193402 [Stegodyphus dumicola]|uniref:uncharacterized protein LOC118193402 n=1 Tax=Stegodyphus dumicola TaxID=202533 RepID=UPI0015AC4F7B|nr:uncharacterized protein LOC118193402 [Stegodyphus dumicola]
MHNTRSDEEDFMKKKKWQEVAKEIFVYSAFIEKCPSDLPLPASYCVKYIGITLSNRSNTDSSASNLKCGFKTESRIVKTGFAVSEKLPEDHFKPCSAAFFYCSLKEIHDVFSWPEYATLFESSILAWIPVEHIRNLTVNLALNVCVRPIYDSYSILHLIEFLAYHSTMGIDHFILYHHNTTHSMQMLFKFLMVFNMSIEILPWDIPLNNDLIHEYGQIVFTQDCISRSKHKFSHALIVDLDEYIVPKIHPNIKHLLEYLDNQHQNAGSYTIPMVLFCQEFQFEKSLSSPFHILYHNKRQKTPWKHWYRSKYVAKPDRVRYGGIHFVWKHSDDWQEIPVTDSLVMLHHYRHCCGMLQTWFLHLFKFYVLSDNVVIDNSLIIHKPEILNHRLLNFFKYPLMS